MSRKKKMSRKQRRELEGTGRIVNEKFQREVVKPLNPKTQKQAEVLQDLREKQAVAYLAPAGTGKTYIIVSHAIDQLKKGLIDKIILSRPAVGMSTNTIGLLKGGMRDKYEPYLMPIVDVIVERYGRGYYEACLQNGSIEMLPLEYCRGRNFRGIAIVDEAQNVTPDEMYSIVTRVSDEGRLFCIGDPTQNDLRSENGLDWLAGFIDNHALGEYMAVHKGNSDEIVRSGLCKAVVKAREADLGITYEDTDSEGADKYFDI